MMHKIGMEGNVLAHCSIKESPEFYHRNGRAGRVLRNHLFHFLPSLGNCFLSTDEKVKWMIVRDEPHSARS